MAARENQGLHIALIIFVVLTLFLSVTTFVFVRNYNNEQQKSKEADAKAAKAAQQAGEMQGERDQYIAYLGFPTTDKLTAVQEAWKADMDAHQALIAKTLPDSEKTYRKVMAGLQGIINSQHAQNEKLAEDLRTAKTVYDQKTKAYEEDVTKLTAEKTQAVQAYLDERAKIAAQNKQLVDSKNELVNQLQDKDAKAASEKTGLQTQLAGVQKNLDQSQTQLKLKTEDYNKISGKFSVNSQPNGKIVWVNERDNMVYINLGSDDLLRKRITFSVFAPLTTDVTAVKTKKEKDSDNNAKADVDSGSEAKRKGIIEVIGVTQPHIAQCRILDSNNSDPLLPGDLIYTPLWRPGQQEHFALIGSLDVDGDGTSDRAKVHDLIRRHGGVIDAEIDEKGNVQGAITYATRYVVKGDTGANAEAAIKMGNDAEKLGVENVDLAKFLDMMGYTSVALDKNVDRPAQAPTAGQPEHNFRPRSPVSKGVTGTTY